MSKEKVCKKCNKLKDITEFHKHSNMKEGYLNRCKRCKYIYDRDRNDKPEIIEKQKLAKVKYVKTHPEKVNESKEKWKKNNPHKRRAIEIIGNAIRYGKISKGICTVCGCVEVHGHHEDYNKPLEVIWLCPSHHRRLHAGLISL